MLKGILPALAALSFLLPAKAFPGIGSVKKVSSELLEELAQVASREGTDAAAMSATRKMAERLGHEVSAVESLLTRYGDSLGLVLRTSERARLFNKLGDDAAQAFIHHGAAAENILTKIPTPDMARTLRQLQHAEVRYLDALVQRGQISKADSANWLRLIKEKGANVLTYAWEHPKITASVLLAGGVGAYALSHPGTAAKAIQQAGSMLDFMSTHPILSAALALLAVVVLLLSINFLAEVPWAMTNWLCHKLMDG